MLSGAESSLYHTNDLILELLISVILYFFNPLILEMYKIKIEIIYFLKFLTFPACHKSVENFII